LAPAKPFHACAAFPARWRGISTSLVETCRVSNADHGGDDDGDGEALNADFRHPPPTPRELTPAVARPGNID